MSGFITIYNTNQEPVDRSLIYSLTQTLKFRGPDQQNVWVDDNIGMGHALFKTTFEAEYENQPATIDNKVWITCSARIDDRENLVNKMGMKKEINLSLTPDSELILHAYRKWGEECLNHLLGDFAFAIWDKTKQNLFCARDRFGVRQLYFAQKNNTFIVCNNLNTIHQYPNMSKNLNDKAIAGFLLFGDHSWLDKSLTIFDDINSLLPAHKLIFKHGKTNIKRYWDIPSDLPLLKYKKRSDYIDHFHEVFKTAVEDRVRTPSITISMSGGMDSSSIAATIRELEKEKRIKNLKLQAVTSVYDRLFSSEERYFSGIVAKHLKIPIHYLAADDYPFVEPSVLTARPVEDYTPDYWLDFKKTVASYSRVVLTGKSGDNLLYYSPAISSLKESNPFSLVYDIFQLHKQYGSMPPLGTGLGSFLKKKLRKKVTSSPYPYPKWFNPEFERKMNLHDLWEKVMQPKNHIQLNPRHPNAYSSITSPDWNTDDFYLVSDFTIPEERDPFLDLRLIEFLFSIPSTPWFFKKHILRESMRGILPDEIINRPKTVLGNMHTELLQQPTSKWISKWKETPNLLKYISKENMPLFSSENIDDETSYVNFRIIMLNSWIKKLHEK